jgi:hypothetical protein
MKLYWEGPGKPDGTEIEWDTSASGLRWWCESTGRYHRYYKEKTEISIDASKEIDLEINVEKTKYMLLSRHQNVGQNRVIKIANRSFENVSHFKYLGTTVTNQNLIQ